MVNDFQKEMEQAVEVQDTPIADASLLNTEEKMRRYVSALAERVRKIEEIINNNNLK